MNLSLSDTFIVCFTILICQMLKIWPFTLPQLSCSWCLQVKPICCSTLHSFLTFCQIFQALHSKLNLFDTSKLVSNTTHIIFDPTLSGMQYTTFDIPWLKTEGSKGATNILIDLIDPTSPIPALCHHLFVNAQVPPGAPLFTFETNDGSWEPITNSKSNWLMRCNEVWIVARLPPLKSHAFQSGRCTELLLCGTNPNIVCVQGCWKLRAFLEYWCKIQKILPLFISNSFTEAHSALVDSSIASFKFRFCNFFPSSLNLHVPFLLAGYGLGKVVR